MPEKQSSVLVHSIVADVYWVDNSQTTATRHTAYTVYRTPISPVDEVTISARPGAGRDFVVDFKDGGTTGHINVRQREYAFLGAEHLRKDLPKDVHEALVRSGIPKMLFACTLWGLGLVWLVSMVSMAIAAATDPLSALADYYHRPLAALGLAALVLTGGLVYWRMLQKNPVRLLGLDKVDGKERAEEWWKSVVWLLSVDLLRGSALLESLDRIWVVEFIEIAKPQGYYRLSRGIVRGLSTARAYPESLASIFGQRTIAITRWDKPSRSPGD